MMLIKCDYRYYLLFFLVILFFLGCNAKSSVISEEKSDNYFCGFSHSDDLDGIHFEEDRIITESAFIDFINAILDDVAIGGDDYLAFRYIGELNSRISPMAVDRGSVFLENHKFDARIICYDSTKIDPIFRQYSSFINSINSLDPTMGFFLLRDTVLIEYLVIALHEVAHILHGDVLRDIPPTLKDSFRKKELKADSLAGFLYYRYHIGPLNELVNVYRRNPSNNKNYPLTEDRINSTISGYYTAASLDLNPNGGIPTAWSPNYSGYSHEVYEDINTGRLHGMVRLSKLTYDLFASNVSNFYKTDNSNLVKIGYTVTSGNLILDELYAQNCNILIDTILLGRIQNKPMTFANENLLQLDNYYIFSDRKFHPQEIRLNRGELEIKKDSFTYYPEEDLYFMKVSNSDTFLIDISKKSYFYDTLEFEVIKRQELELTLDTILLCELISDYPDSPEYFDFGFTVIDQYKYQEFPRSRKVFLVSDTTSNIYFLTTSPKKFESSQKYFRGHLLTYPTWTPPKGFRYIPYDGN